jgi:hypothetical protein
LHNFKTKNRIVSRKIVKLVSVKRRADEEVLRQSMAKFMLEMEPFLMAKSPEKIFNTDQMGVSLELTSGRTLFTKGARRVEMTAQRLKGYSFFERTTGNKCSWKHS